MTETNTFQVQRFATGEFCIHRIVAPTHKGRLSCWFDASGKPTDAEQYIPTARIKTRHVKRGGPIWRYLETLGKVWVNP